MLRKVTLCALGVALFFAGWFLHSPAPSTVYAGFVKDTPADGHTIHVTAPHMLNGKVMGPYHHYCKAVSSEVLECLIYESTEPNALLKQVEYFVAKTVTRNNVPRRVWNSYYHDHAVEIASGRVQVLDLPPDEAKKVAEAAAKTDGIIFHLWWPDDAKVPSGTVMHPQAVGHKDLSAAEYAASAK